MELVDEPLVCSADRGANVPYCFNRHLRVQMTSSYVAWSIFLGIVLLALWAATSSPVPFLGPT
jgi:hypothetical protein